jgi:hypothetical protein
VDVAASALSECLSDNNVLVVRNVLDILINYFSFEKVVIPLLD